MSDATRTTGPAAGRSSGRTRATGPVRPAAPQTSPRLDDFEQATSGPFPRFEPDDAAATLDVFRVLRPDGTLVAADPALENGTGVADDDALAMLRTMVRVRALDDRMLGLQRQGRIGFYGAATGQEAATIAAGHALELRDWVHPALREGGILLHRGWPLWSYLAACFGNADDTSTRGRQMPCHYGSRQYNYVTLSSVMATQYPQAVGTAYAMALQHDAPDRPVCLGCIGDGATSEGDFHAALTFAGVMRPRGLGLPLVLYCQNNQWAISTPVERQTAARSLALKAAGYGLCGARVDGNDALAVLRVMRAAVASARAGGVPAFVEAVTYRVGAHSTSDDPTRYRDEAVTQRWKALDPIVRLAAYLAGRGVLAPGDADRMAREADDEVRTTLAQVEKVGPPPVPWLFEDVYAAVPAALAAERDALLARLAAVPVDAHG